MRCDVDHSSLSTVKLRMRGSILPRPRDIMGVWSVRHKENFAFFMFNGNKMRRGKFSGR